MGPPFMFRQKVLDELQKTVGDVERAAELAGR